MNPSAIKVACSNCNLRELCMPMGLSEQELLRVDELVTVRRTVKRGASLFHNGEKFTSLYAIRTGFFKTCLATEDGRDQVTGFQMAGEIIGLDGIVNKIHPGPAMDKNLYDLPPAELAKVPTVCGSLQEAIDSLMADHEFLLKGGVFSKDQIESYLELKQEEQDRYRMTPHPVEFDMYYSS